MADLCTVDDVKRKLHIRSTDIDDERDGWLQDEIDTATSWFTRIARQDWGADTGGTKVYFDVKETDAVDLPAPNASVTEIRVQLEQGILYGVQDITVLRTDLYDVDAERSQIRLRPALQVQVFENAYAQRPPRTWRRVEVDWEPSLDAVPQSVRDGIAILAAGQYVSSPRLASGLTSEKIGDYSYQVRQVSGSAAPGSPMTESSGFTEEGMRLLRPWIRRRVSVT